MKRSLLFLFCVVLVSCADFDEINMRLDNLENSAATKPKDSECINCRLLQMSFSYKKNPKQLINDISCDIVNDSIVECWIPYVVEDKLLVPDLKYDGNDACFDEVKWSGEIKYDFGKPVKLTINNDSLCKDYMVYVHSYTGIPRLYIETQGRQEIVSKVNYLDASFKMVEDVSTRSPGEVVQADVEEQQTFMTVGKLLQHIQCIVTAAVVGEEESDIGMLLHIMEEGILRETLRFVIAGDDDNGFHDQMFEKL